MEKATKKKTRCIACGNSKSSSYFRFPIKEQLREQWLQRCGLQGKAVPASAKLCAEHFTLQSYSDGKNNAGCRRRLKRDALPEPFVYTMSRANNSDTVDADEDTPGQTNATYCFVCGSFDSDFRATFCFPRDEARRNEWFDIIGTEHCGKRSMTSDLRLCDTHFRSEDIYYYPQSGYHRLRRNAIPLRITVPDESLLDESEASAVLDEICGTPDQRDTFAISTTPTTVTTPTSHFDQRDTLAISTTPTTVTTPTSHFDQRDTFAILTTPTSHLPSVSTSLPDDHHYAQRGSGSRRRIYVKPRYVGDVHTPHLSTPRRAKECFQLSRRVICRQRKTIDLLTRRLRNARRKIKTLDELISHLRKTDRLTESSASNLSATTSETLKALLIRGTESKKKKYAPELRKFALSLQYYSTKAYLFVRKAFANLLPALSTIRRYCTVLNMDPGISKDVLEILQAVDKKKGKPIVYNFLMDEMSLKEHTIRKGGRAYGYVNLGVENDCIDNEILSHDGELEKANHVLVFLLNALNGHWKVPIAYFLIRNMNSKQRANLVSITLQKMYEYNIHTYSMTMDGVSSNLATADELGAVMDFQKTTYQPYFYHPVSKEKIFVFIDPCHDIKNVRNALGTTYNPKTGVEIPFNDAEDGIISWKHIYELNLIQKEEGVHAANKITDRHIQYAENKMNVRLATQTLSNSVGDALRFLRLAEDVVTDYNFDDSAGTSEFCKNFNDIFDMFNCRTRYKQDMKQPHCIPLTRENFQERKQWAAEKINYIKGLQQNGVKCTAFRRKCAFQAFIGCLTNIFSLFEILRDKHDFQYLLSYKLLQDMLETFFSAVRMRGGFCNNPTPYQCQTAIRRLVMHTQVMWATTGNCDEDDVPILHVSSTSTNTAVESEDDADDDDDNASFELFNFKEISIPSNFVQHVVRYVSGYIVFQLKVGRCRTTCADCFEYVTEVGGTSLLTDVKNRGPLKYASEPVIAIGMWLETAIRENKNTCLSDTSFPKKCTTAMMQYIAASNYFVGEHFTNNPQHVLIMVKFIVKLYLTVRLHHEHSISNIVEKYVRRVNTKLTLFKHQ